MRNSEPINEMRRERGLTDTTTCSSPRDGGFFGGTASLLDPLHQRQLQVSGRRWHQLERLHRSASAPDRYAVSPRQHGPRRPLHLLRGRCSKLDNAELHFGDRVRHSCHYWDYAAPDLLQAAAIWRQYIPLGATSVSRCSGWMSLSAGGTQARFANDSPVKGTKRATPSRWASRGHRGLRDHRHGRRSERRRDGITYNHAKQVHQPSHRGQAQHEHDELQGQHLLDRLLGMVLLT